MNLRERLNEARNIGNSARKESDKSQEVSWASIFRNAGRITRDMSRGIVRGVQDIPKTVDTAVDTAVGLAIMAKREIEVVSRKAREEFNKGFNEAQSKEESNE